MLLQAETLFPNCDQAQIKLESSNFKLKKKSLNVFECQRGSEAGILSLDD